MPPFSHSMSMMEPLYFIATWKRVKEQSWSGTSWALLQALSAHYAISDINVKQSVVRRALQKLIPAFHDMGLGSILRYRAAFQNHISEGKVFQFEEYCRDSETLKTYIYKDLSVSYLEYVAKTNKEMFSHSGFAHIPLQSIERKARMEREYHSSCSGIFTMSRWLREFLIEHDGISPDKVYHVGGGINVNSARIQPHQRQGNKILFAGRDFDRKGGTLVCEAFKRLRNRISDAELHIAGPAKRPRISNIKGVFYHGDVHHDKLSDLLNLCDVFCMPSQFEAYGLVFPEALCYGLPCIGRQRQEMPHFIDDKSTGRLLQGDSPEELCEMMHEILTQPRYAENVKKRQREYIHQYSWNSVAGRIHEVMR